MIAGGRTSRSSFGGNTRWVPEDRFNGGALSLRENPPFGARTDRAALHLWASRFSYQLFQPAPEQLIVVAAVSLASQRRIA